MAHVRRFDHVGITVADLDAVTAGITNSPSMTSACTGRSHCLRSAPAADDDVTIAESSLD